VTDTGLLGSETAYTKNKNRNVKDETVRMNLGNGVNTQNKDEARGYEVTRGLTKRPDVRGKGRARGYGNRLVLGGCED
jgi:hypothetical protein